jgi:hypothetical protein
MSENLRLNDGPVGGVGKVWVRNKEVIKLRMIWSERAFVVACFRKLSII